ncbi:transcription termination factor Rho [Amycolatopsis suaedae]|uniref:Transcription termination factor Rho n=1 Tax=Amycolatopsis suaedae TaxID=2510978 RepID=A0A4Q7J2R6_9PSEU|nr:transcription termination factor Rho [Amycolatopsis suaedae]RZQ60882.1 transcription termination factor Rho [Amycolatopsis suaedae]
MSNTDLLSDGTDTKPASPETAENGAAAPKRRPGGLSGMVIADLRELAVELGISDTTGMRKGDLIAAIRERQGKSKRRPAASETLPLEGIADKSDKAPKADVPAAKQDKPAEEPKAAKAPKTDEAPAPEKAEQQERKPAEETQSVNGNQPHGNQDDQGQSGDEGGRREGGRRRRGSNRAAGAPDGQQQGDQQQRGQQRGQGGQGDQQRGQGGQQNQGKQGGRQQQDDDGEDGGGRRGRRFRDRRRRGGRGEGNPDTEVREDDVLLPVAGILDVLDNYAFVRTSGYLAGPNDVYVSLSLVRKYGLRRGDAITGVVRQPREGEQQRQKFNPLVRVDSINGQEPEAAKSRPDFTKLTPLYPNERLRLETESHKLTTRVIDLVMPVGKGQRALIVSPPKAGKTTIMQDIANAITTNNPECHLMVVLVDERPEEVTDMQRSVKGEVIASTFDRPPSDHTSVAELSIERAKRLVEMGLDVVVLLDSITRLGRAYNLAAPASGRILSGGVDSTALFPPKRFLGAARNIENGGSLTIFATAMVETGSTGDTVIFEEFKGTGNAELKLDRKIAERRVFPAVDINPSGTRKEELLLSPDELAVTLKLHRVLHALDSQQAIDLLLSRLRKTKTNIEFLMQVSKTALGPDED